MDAHSAEQGALLKAYHFGAKGHNEPSGSISPYVPCASRRIPAVLRAARLRESDCFWDLGCGDGRMCHQAAAQYGCDCVGVEIVEPCVEEAKMRAQEQQLDNLCRFAVCDMTKLEPGALQADANGYADLSAACKYWADEGPLRAPTCLVLFITSHGLSRLKRWLREEWRRGGLRIVSCVERLDTCFDYEAEDPLFGGDVEEDDEAWPIYAAHERDGVFVVPPFGTSLEEWAEDERAWDPRPVPTPAEADASEPALLRSLLGPEDIAALCSLGDELGCHLGTGAPSSMGSPDGSANDSNVPTADVMDSFDIFDDEAVACAEDCMHADREHRVIHLHRQGTLQGRLPRLVERILQAVRVRPRPPLHLKGFLSLTLGDVYPPVTALTCGVRA